ncbi:MAG: hypothetical protein ACFHX7_10200 [Pseudomonadota bacterium]
MLPFRARSTEPDEQLFANGLAADLVENLSLLPDVRVVARAASFRYPVSDADYSQLGDTLQAGILLTGAIQRHNDQLKIVVDLVDAANTEVIWSQTLEGPTADVFVMQEKIITAVTTTLNTSLPPKALERLESRTGTISFEAYYLYLLATEQLHILQGGASDADAMEEGVQTLLQELNQVLSLDPTYADAYRALARAYNHLAVVSRAPENRQQLIQQGRDALEQARRLDPDNPRNLLVAARLTLTSGDLALAEVIARQAYEKLPNDAEAINNLAELLFLQNKKPGEQLELVNAEAAIDPTNPDTYRRRALALSDLGRHEAAEQTIQAAIAESPAPHRLAPDLALLYRDSGRQLDAAIALYAYQEAQQLDPDTSFQSAWFNSLARLGLPRQMEQVLNNSINRPRQPFQTIGVAQVLFTQNSAIGARRWLERRTGASGDQALRYALGQVCFELGDFECARDNMLNFAPLLADNKQTLPRVQQKSDFMAGLTLAFSYRYLMQPAPEQRLINAMAEYVDVREGEGHLRLPFYLWPKWHLLLGYRDIALEQIRESILMEGDSFIPLCEFCSFESPMFESVAADPGFQILVAEYHRRKAASAKRLEEFFQANGGALPTDHQGNTD